MLSSIDEISELALSANILLKGHKQSSKLWLAMVQKDTSISVYDLDALLIGIFTQKRIYTVVSSIIPNAIKEK